MDTEPERRLAAGMASAQRGDAAAYRDLLRDCVPEIAAVARARGVPPDRVDDVVQDTLLTLHRVRHTYDPARPFLPWLRAIARRRAVDERRRYGRRRAREVHDPSAYERHPDAAPSAFRTLEDAERARRLHGAVAALPDGQREAVEHLALRERSAEDASAATGRSRGALKVNLHRALKVLRTRLAGEWREDG